MEFETLLGKISVIEMRKFVLQYSKKNPEFKTELEVYFADKDEGADHSKKYSEWVKKIIRKYQHRGYIEYKDSFSFAAEIQNIVDTGFELADKKNFLGAFNLGRVVLEETMKAATDCDDSSGNIGDTIMSNIDLLNKIAADPDAGNPLKEKMLWCLMAMVKEDIYFDYGNFGYELVEVFQLLAKKIGNHDVFLKHLDDMLSKPAKAYGDYDRNFYITQKIEFLKSVDRLSEADDLIALNMDIVEIRQGMVDQAIAAADYGQAKALIAGGIEIAEEKNHPGIVSDWNKHLLRVAMLEQDVPAIRHYCKNFAFDRGFNKEYYQIWKGTYLSDEWNAIIEAYIEEAIVRATEAMSQYVQKGWQGQRLLSLLHSVAQLYIEEGYLDRLMALVQQEDSLFNIFYYHDVLVKTYSSELLQVYLPAIKKAGIEATDRKRYQDLVKKMKQIIKDIPEGKEQILTVAKELRTMYYRRPAMVEELTRLIGY